eukprot:5290636-Prymnesium_polylepis.2
MSRRRGTPSHMCRMSTSIRVRAVWASARHLSANQPGLSTHTPALTSQFEQGAEHINLNTSVRLGAGAYTVIAHARYAAWTQTVAVGCLDSNRGCWIRNH